MEGNSCDLEAEAHKHERGRDVRQKRYGCIAGTQRVADRIDIGGTRRAKHERDTVEEECRGKRSQ